MEDKTLLKLSILVLVLGLTILCFFVMTNEIPKFEGKVNQNMDGETVKINGKVIGVENKNKVTIVKLKYDSFINIVAFGKPLSLREGDNISIIGKIRFYNGKEEIIAEELLT